MTKQATLTLAERGLDKIAEAMEWHPATIWSRPAYRFPIWNTRGQVIGYRIKFLDDGKMRYTFENLDGEYSQPDTAKYYFAPNAITQIRRKATVFVAEGEPDVLTLYAMGCGNALCWFNGASGAPKSFFEDMHLLGAKTVVYIPDRDYTGLSAALKLFDLHATCEHDITLRVKEVPGQDGVDLNEAYQAAGFKLNEVTFKNLTQEEISAEVAMLKPVRKGEVQAEDDFQINPRVRDALIAHAKSIGKTTGDDNRIGIPSFNEHKTDTPGEHASFYVGSLTAKDYSGGRRYLTNELVELWGIDIEALGGWTAKTTTTETKTPSTPLKNAESVNGHSSPNPPAIPPDFFVTGEQSMQLAKAALAGDNPSIVIRNPVQAIHDLTGYAKNLEGGMIMAVMAPSGGGKTTLFGTMAEHMIRRGENIIFWTGEWSAKQMAQRRIQSYGGATMNQMLDDAIDNNLPMDIRKKSIEIANNLEYGDLGHVSYVNQKYTDDTLALTLHYMGLRIRELEARGKSIHAVFFDYIQLANLEDSIRAKNMAEAAFEQFKKFIMTTGRVGFMSSQVTKEAEDRIMNGGTLRPADANYIRLDKGNLVCGLAPVYAGGDHKERQSFLRLDVFKNSLGPSGHVYLDDRNRANLEIPIGKALDKRDVETRLARLNDKSSITF